MHVKPHGLAHFLEAAAKHLRQRNGAVVPLRVAQEEVPMAGGVGGASDRLRTRGGGLRGWVRVTSWDVSGLGIGLARPRVKHLLRCGGGTLERLRELLRLDGLDSERGH